MLAYKTDKETVLRLTNPCRCNACENSCNYGSGALIEADLKNLAKFFNMSEEDVKAKYLDEFTKFNTVLLKPKIDGKPYGKCIFYNKTKGCTVHPVKPFECRIAMGCKSYGEELIIWFNLNNYLNPDDPESLRQYKLYLESGGKTLPGAELINLVDNEIFEKLSKYEDLKDDTDWEAVLGLKENGK